MTASIFSLYDQNTISGTSGFVESFNARSKQLAQKVSPFGQGDTVSFSDNAKELSATGYSGSIGRVSGLQVSRAGEDMGTDTSATFAADIMRRIGELDEDSSRNAENAQRLENSLTGTLESVSARYGKRAATAVMGAVYKSIGDGPVTEENLGNGFLEAIRLVDKNFGVAEGDKFMAGLNKDLNQSLNEFFDNGRNETFFAVNSTEQLQFEISRAGQAATDLGQAMGNLVDVITDLTDASGTSQTKKNMNKELEEQLEEELQRRLEESQTEKLVQQYSAFPASGFIGESLDISV